MTRSLQRTRDMLLGHYIQQCGRLAHRLEMLRYEHEWSLLDEPIGRKRPRSLIAREIDALLPKLQGYFASLHDLWDIAPPPQRRILSREAKRAIDEAHQDELRALQNRSGRSTFDIHHTSCCPA